MPINSPIELDQIAFEKQVRAPGGAANLYLMLADVEEFNKAPDVWAARHFGLSVDEYLEWVELEGVPLCGAKTRTGSLCRNMISGGIQRRASEWKEAHRSDYCAVHGGPPSEKA